MNPTIPFSRPIADLVRQRYSCRTYRPEPIQPEVRQRLDQVVASQHTGPLGTHSRFSLVTAEEGDSRALRGLGTYGFVRGATGYIIGVTRESRENLVDYGFLMEEIVLFVTDLGLGSCWLGGSFTKSRFAQRVRPTASEIVPAVVAIGIIAEKPRAFDKKIREIAKADRRRPWERLFHLEQFNQPCTPEQAGDYALALEMVRLAPSASNKQPWQVVLSEDCFHFYLRRTPGYRESYLAKFLNFADLQRIDLGIAMCHFERTARENGLSGKWVVGEPDIQPPDAFHEYIASWKTGHSPRT